MQEGKVTYEIKNGLELTLKLGQDMIKEIEHYLIKCNNETQAVSTNKTRKWKIQRKY